MSVAFPVRLILAIAASVESSAVENRGVHEAESAEVLHLDALLEAVDARYPSVVAALQARAEAAGSLTSAEGAFDPSVRASGFVEASEDYPRRWFQLSVDQPTSLWGTSLFGGYRLSGGKFPAYEGKLDTEALGELRAGVKIPLWRDGPIDRRRAGVRQAELGVRIAELSTLEQRIEARRLATLRFWDWVAAGARLDIIRSWLDLARNRDAAIAARVKHGDIPELEWVENQRTLLQREAALAAAERDAEQTALELGLFLRGPEGEANTPGPGRRPKTLPKPAPLDLDLAASAESIALARRPELARLEAQRDRSAVDLDLANNQRAPGIELSAAGTRNLGPDRLDQGRSELELMLLVDIPILNRVQNGRADSARSAVARTDAQLRLARDRVLADVRATRVSMKTALERVDTTEQELILARRLAEGELRKFDLGESTLVIVNLREQATTEAEIRHLDVLLEYHRATAGFLAAIAHGFE